MHTLKTITLALMLIIFSVAGLRAEEISLEQFIAEFLTATQSQDAAKIEQLFMNNPNTARLFQQKLTGENKVDYSELDSLQKEGNKAFYIFDYPTALKKWQLGLEKAQKLGNKGYISQFIGSLGVVYDNLGDYPKALDHYQQALKIKKEIGDKDGIGDNLNNIGVVYQNLGQYQKALSYYRQSLEIDREIDDKHGEGTVLGNIGDVYSGLGQYQKALTYHQQALIIARKIGDKHGIGNNLSGIGIAHDKLVQYQKALTHYQDALTIFREISDKRGEGASLANICSVHNNLGQYQQALTYCQQALTIFRNIGNRREEGASLGGIGMVYYHLYQYQTALDYYQQALTISREIGNRSIEKATLVNVGNVYFFLNQHKQALTYYHKALAISREIGDRRKEGQDLNSIGSMYLSLSQYQQALTYYQQALTISREIGDKHWEGNQLNNIGEVYRNLGLDQKALTNYQQALTISREIGDKHAEGGELNNIGIVYNNLGQHQQALTYSQQALTISRKFNDRHSIGNNLSNIGIIYKNLAQYKTALEYYQQALKIRRGIKDRRGETIVLTNIGNVYLKLGKYQQAKDVFQDSLAISISIGSKETWRIQRGLAYVEAKLNQPESAIQHYEQAIDNIEKIRNLLTKEHKISFMRNKIGVYDDFIALLQSLHSVQPKKGYDRKAIEIFERKQGRVFLEEMGKSGARRFTGIPKNIVQNETELVQKIEAARKSRTEALAQGKNAEPHRNRLEKLQAEFEKTLQTNYPAYYALKYPKPVTLKTLQKNVLKSDEFTLIYNVREKDTDLWVIGKNKFQMLTLNISEDELQDKVDAFRTSPNTFIEAIKTEPSWAISDLAEDNLPSLRQASYDLYQLLMPEKARTLFKDARTLYIVPTGPLYGLPFGALDTHNPAQHDTPHYLIQDYPIAYLSSASLLKTIRDTKRDETSQRYPFLAFAHPQYPKNCSSTSDDATQVIQSLRTQSYLKLAGRENKACFGELPETKVQAETIAKLLKAPKHSNALQLRAKASRQNVFDFSDKKRLKDYQYVLFAAHAVLPNEISYINQSAIVLSNPDTEGYLTMADAFALDMNADLVMLSACNTGRGEKIKGEGIRGLTRAFMYAGTPAVSVSLWSVESRSAKALSISLFKYLQVGKPLAQALRQSKLDLMADEDFEMYQHPYFWAPFVVFGDGN